MTEDRKSFCRLCTSHCGMIVTVDDQAQIVAIRPDRDDLNAAGFACFKGLQAPEAYRAKHRVLRPLKRQADGRFEPIALDQALDEIAEKLAVIVARDGPEAVGAYKGSGAGLNASANLLMNSLLAAIGTPKLFSCVTIDQSAKFIAWERLGTWPPGFHPFYGSEVVLTFGSNPVVSFANYDAYGTLKKTQQLVENGLKILVVDPRFTETARMAHRFLQPLPGEDATIAAGMIRLILSEGWEDKEFVARHVAQLDALRKAVDPFTPDYVARRADLDPAAFIEMTRIFATAQRGRAHSGTGANMGPHSNLVEHLIQTINIICGRFVREGERIANPGVLLRKEQPKVCQVVPAQRSYDKGYKSRIGDFGLHRGELPTGIMADEILEPGPGQVKAFFVHGGNPAVIVPDQLKVVKAFRSLELLVTIDPYMTPTAQLSDYVLPAVLPYERPDLPCWQVELFGFYPKPFTRYTDQVSQPPPGSEVVHDNDVVWGLAKRLGLQLEYFGVRLDMDNPPTIDDLLEIVARPAPVDFETLRSMEMGGFFEGEPQYAQPGAGGPDDRFTVAPPDIVEEIESLAEEDIGAPVVVSNGRVATHRFAVRRGRNLFNSIGRELDSIRKRTPHNTALMNPADLAKIGVETGDLIVISSVRTSAEAVAEADPTVRRGVVSMTHGFGILPEETRCREHGTCSNILISTDQDLDIINAMPRMTAFRVAVSAKGPTKQAASAH